MVQDDATVSKEFLGLSINPNDDTQLSPMAHEGIIAKDITGEFAEAVKSALEPGELVKDGYFTLFEAVAAVEIMDPKMDSGFQTDGSSVDEEYDVTRPLLPKEVLGLIDQLLCLEIAWHLGYPLSQTLLSNVYLDAMLVPEPATIQDAHFIRNETDVSRDDPMFVILRAYCMGLLKTCSLVNECIKEEQYYEEEDFVSNTYNRSLLSNLDLYDIRDTLTAARKVAYDLRLSIPPELSQALDCRLEVRTALLRALELADRRSNPESLKLPWKQLQGVWGNVYKSHKYGVPVPEAFSTKVQRRLASTLPPRPIVDLKFEETHEHFKRLAADSIEAIDVLKYSDSQSLLNFVMTLHQKKPQPMVFVRAFVQGFLFKDMVMLGRFSIRDILDDDLSLVVLPGSRLLDRANDDVEVPHDVRYAIAHQMEEFRQRVAPAYLDIFRALCQNRPRVRRILCHSLQEWETIQMDAESIDLMLQVQLEETPILPPGEGSLPAYSLPLSSWAYLYKLRLMECIVQLGFELETYQPDEVGGLYWYLSYLSRTRGQHTDRIKTFALHAINTIIVPTQLPPMHSAEAQYTRSLAYFNVNTRDAMVVSDFSDALCCLYTVLRRLKLVVAPPRPYSTDPLRYHVRMKPFMCVGLPGLPSYREFVDASTRPTQSTEELLDYVDRALESVKRIYGIMIKVPERETFTAFAYARWLESTRNCLKSAVAAGVAIATLRKHLADPSKLKVEVPKPDKRYHAWWIVPVITTEEPESRGVPREE